MALLLLLLLRLLLVLLLLLALLLLRIVDIAGIAAVAVAVADVASAVAGGCCCQLLAGGYTMPKRLSFAHSAHTSEQDFTLPHAMPPEAWPTHPTIPPSCSSTLLVPTQPAPSRCAHQCDTIHPCPKWALKR